MEGLRLFKKTDTTLVYIATGEFAKAILGERYSPGANLYIHVDRAYGSIQCYFENMINKMVPLDSSLQKAILEIAEPDRD